MASQYLAQAFEYQKDGLDFSDTEISKNSIYMFHVGRGCWNCASVSMAKS